MLSAGPRVQSDAHSCRRGRPEVPNGLCLRKIQHGACDVNIVGVDPDYRVHVCQDVLEAHDGPMLRHGLPPLPSLRHS
jgi:putative restriction endonuclease